MDTENTPVAEVAPQVDEAQGEQVASTEREAESPAPAADTDELIGGKFRSEADLDKASRSLDEKLAEYRQKQAEFTRLSQAMARSEVNEPRTGQEPAGAQEEIPEFDEPTRRGIQAEYARLREIEKAQEFQRRHAEELQNPIVDGLVRKIMADARTSGQYVDQEEALAQAKKIVEQNLTPKVAEAKQEGVAEGQDLARKKDQLGAVGQSGAREKIDPSQLSSKEFAQFHGLSYDNTI